MVSLLLAWINFVHTRIFLLNTSKVWDIRLVHCGVCGTGLLDVPLGIFSPPSMKSTLPPYIEGILPKGPYPPCLRMADRALLAGYPGYEDVCSTSRYPRQGHVITSHSICGMQLLVFARDTASCRPVLIYSLRTFANIQGYTTTNNIIYHDDVIKWKHFPRYWSLVRGIHQSPVNSPHKGQ